MVQKYLDRRIGQEEMEDFTETETFIINKNGLFSQICTDGNLNEEDLKQMYFKYKLI